MSSVGARRGGYRRWLSAVPPGKSSGRLRQKVMPCSTSRTPSRTFSGVRRLMRPSSSLSPQSPQVEPSGRRVQRCVTAVLPCSSLLVPTGRTAVPRYSSCGQNRTRRGSGMTDTNGLVVSADGHILEPTDLFLTRLPKHLRDRAVWEEDFQIEPLVEGGVRDFRRLHTPG